MALRRMVCSSHLILFPPIPTPLSGGSVGLTWLYASSAVKTYMQLRPVSLLLFPPVGVLVSVHVRFFLLVLSLLTCAFSF